MVRFVAYFLCGICRDCPGFPHIRSIRLDQPARGAACSRLSDEKPLVSILPMHPSTGGGGLVAPAIAQEP